MWDVVNKAQGEYLVIDTPVEMTYRIIRPKTDLGSIKAIMMDMDGSSTDTEKLVLEAMRQMMADSLDQDGFAFVKEDFPNIIGDSTTNHVTYLINKYGLDMDRRSEYINGYYTYYHKTLEDIRDGKISDKLIEPMPHLGEFLLWARELGVKLGVVTSSIQWELDIIMPEVFKSLGWDPDYKAFYDAVISADAVGEPFLKPHPNLYILMAEMLDISSGEGIVIEDSTAGIVAGRAAGFSVAAVPHHHNEGHSFEMADLGIQQGGLKDVQKMLMDAGLGK